MNARVILILVSVCSATAIAIEPVFDPALSPDELGLAIAEESARRDTGFGDSMTELTMTLTNAEGRARTRRLTWATLEARGGREGDRALAIFHEPRDIEGTAFLSYTHIDRDDDQWLYLPALRRVKRIAASNRSSAFVGSEFAYEDLLSDEVERYEHRWLEDTDCGDWRCFMIERRPRYADSGYSRQIVWIDQDEYRPVRIEFYDRNDRLQKTLLFEEYRQYLDRFWRAHVMRMSNHLTERSTVLSFSNYEFQTGLTERDFDPSVLRLLP